MGAYTAHFQIVKHFLDHVHRQLLLFFYLWMTMMSGSVCSDFHGRIMNAFFFFFFCNAWRSWVLIYVVLYLKHFRLSESFEGYVMWMIRYSKSFKSILSRGTFFWPGNECSTMNVIKSLFCFYLHFAHFLKLFIYFYFIIVYLLLCFVFVVTSAIY